MAVSLDDFTIVSDGFILCRDSGGPGSGGVFWTDDRDGRMTADNLRFFTVVKLPWNAEEHDWNGFKLRLGDEVVSVATGTDLSFPGEESAFKLFDLKYITAKREPKDG